MIKRFKLKEQRGFSLVELMIVVAIIAILAAIAIPAFMRFAMKAKTSEATGNLSAIRTCQEAYRAEDDVYLVCPTTPLALGTPASKPQPWPAAGIDGVDEFAMIGFAPDGDVRYTYTVNPITDPNVFVAVATGDLDDDGAVATFTITKGDDGYPKPVKGGDDF